MIDFEDLAVGEVFDLGASRLEREEVVAFSRAYDPALAHEEIARPVASCWLLPCVWMRHWLAFVERQDAASRAAGRRVSGLGPSPGFERMAWPSQARAGDTVMCAAEVLTVRPSGSRPEWGLLSMQNTVHRAEANGDTSLRSGSCLLSFVSTAFIERAPV